MGCRCGGGAGTGAQSDIIGYRAYLPDGTVTPPEGDPPFFSYNEAHTTVLLAGGGVTKAVRKSK